MVVDKWMLEGVADTWLEVGGRACITEITRDVEGLAPDGSGVFVRVNSWIDKQTPGHPNLWDGRRVRVEITVFDEESEPGT